MTTPVRRPKYLLYLLLVLEVVFFLAVLPASRPQNRDIRQAFRRWNQEPTDANRAAFDREMDLARASERRRQKIALVLLIVNGFAVIILYRGARGGSPR